MKFRISIEGTRLAAWDNRMIKTSPFFVLDYVRNHGHPNALAKDVKVEQHMGYDISISISEELARKCGHFEEINVGNAVKIKVPRLFLNSFRKPSFKKYGKEEKDLEVYFSWEFDQEGFLKKWEADGFPLSYEKEK